MLYSVVMYISQLICRELLTDRLLFSCHDQAYTVFAFLITIMGICNSMRSSGARSGNMKHQLKSTYTYRDLPKMADGTNTADMADSLQEVIPNVVCTHPVHTTHLQTHTNTMHTYIQCVGSAVAAKDLALLNKNGITHILAIGWNLEKHFEGKFAYLLLNEVEDGPEYLILRHLGQCLDFLTAALVEGSGNKVFVHCHKGLSRSATVVIASEMHKTRQDFESVFFQIKKRRPFIMPNIGFQAQLHAFHEKGYSLDMADYEGFSVLGHIQRRLPAMLARIRANYAAFDEESEEEVDENELFELTMYTHQAHKLRQKDKLEAKDIEVLRESVAVLRQIQVEFVHNEMSLMRFDVMFDTGDKVETCQK